MPNLILAVAFTGIFPTMRVAGILSPYRFMLGVVAAHRIAGVTLSLRQQTESSLGDDTIPTSSQSARDRQETESRSNGSSEVVTVGETTHNKKRNVR